MTDWRQRAVCRGMELAVFFPEGMRARTALEVAAAKEICGRCPVRTHCLNEGLRETHGVWGGKSARERERLRARLEAAS